MNGVEQHPANARGRRTARTLVIVIAGTVIVSFLYIVYGYVFSNGLCCGDDSYIAGTAKNFAQGRGYATSIPIEGVEGLRLFDPLVSTGPTVVLPAAVLIKLFGATPWAPGLATAVVATGVLVLVAVVVGRQVGAARAAALLALMLALQYTLTAGPRFVHWYALLGEVPAAMLTILGIAVLAWGRGGRRVVALSFLALGLAVMAKTLALLGAVPVGIWLVVRLVRSRGRGRQEWIELGVGTGCFVAPFVAFETWKALSLGWAEYLINLKDFGTFFSSTDGDLAVTDVASMYGRVVANSVALWDNYGFGIKVLVLGIAGICLVVQLSANQQARTFCWLAVASGMTHIAYFLAGSGGNPRYALIGLLVLAAGAASVALIDPSGRAVVVAAAIVAISCVPAQPRLLGPISYVAETDYRPNARVQNLQAAADFLAHLERDEPLVGSWWATVDDLDYMLPTVSNFETVEEIDIARPRAGRVLARNVVFVNLAPSPLYREWEQVCDEVLFDAPPYLITACPSDVGP